MTKRKFALTMKEIISNSGVFLGLYLGFLPFLIMISINTGLIFVLVLPTVAIILGVLATVPQSLLLAEEAVKAENEEIMNMIKDPV